MFSNLFYPFNVCPGAAVVVIVWYLELQRLSIATLKVASSNPDHGQVYSIHYVIKFVSHLWQVFSWYPGFLHQ